MDEIKEIDVKEQYNLSLERARKLRKYDSTIKDAAKAVVYGER